MFIDVKKAHLNAKCDEEESVALPDEFRDVRQVEEVAEEASTIFYHPTRRRCVSSCTATTSRLPALSRN